MNAIQINPNLLQLYTQMTKNEILLHMTLRSLAEAGKVRRNVAAICRVIGKRNRQRVRDAEHGLQKRGLLRVRTVGTRDFWYLSEMPVDSSSAHRPDVATPSPAPRGVTPGRISSDSRPKRRRFWRRLRDAFVGTRLDDFEIEAS